MPGIIGAVVAVERVQPGLLKHAHDRYALLKAPAPLHIVLARQDTLVKARRLAGDTVTHEHREVLAAALFDAAYHLR